MASLSNAIFLKISNVSHQSLRSFHVGAIAFINSKWREMMKLPANPNSFGPLTNLPDYSFTDNRPVPYSSNQKKRIDEQRERYIKIKELSGQIDYAIKKHEMLQINEQQKKQQILDSKLKEKGSKLLLSKVNENKQ